MVNQVRCKTCKHVNEAGATTCVRCGSPIALVDLQIMGGPDAARANAPKPGSDSLRPGQVVASRYVIEGVVGRGGMGRIYRVHDNTLDEVVALKTLLPEYVRDKMIVDRFFNEARIARALSHPNIVRVHDIGTADGLVYISMELLQGESLREAIEGLMPGARMPVKRILSLLDGLCAALEYAHDYTIHRDIKPENVMVLPDDTIKLMDFGISKLMANTRMTSASMVMGTPHYMSPEQLRNSASVDARSDIYSVGVVLYELLTGNTPTGLLQPVSETGHQVPPSLDPIVETCLQHSPEKRYQNVTELRAALREVREIVEHTEGPLQLKQPGALGVAKSSSDLMKKVAGVALVLAVLVGAGFGLWRAEKVRAEAMNNGASRAAAASGMNTQESFDTLFKEAQALQIQARKHKNEIAGEDTQDPIVQVLRGSSKKLTDARKSARKNVGEAANLVLRAMQGFAAVIVWPDDMVYVPADPQLSEQDGADAFFIDSYEVSLFEYKSLPDWPWPSGAPLEDSYDPITHVSYYDALAYAASQHPPKKLPSASQWTRAFETTRENGRLKRADLPPDYGGDEAESATDFEAEDTLGQRALFAYPDLRIWTRTVSASYAASLSRDAHGAAAPTFHSPMVTVGAWVDGFGELAASQPEYIRYESRFEDVGFRCVLEIPRSLSGIRGLLAAVK